MCRELNILENCKSLNDACRLLFGKASYSNRERVKKILLEQGIDWQVWLRSIKEEKKNHCLFCGKELNNNRKKFCDNSCAAKYNNKLRKKERFCKNCGKPLDNTRSIYCSCKCQKEFEYKEYIKRWKNGEESGAKGEYGTSCHIRRYLFEKKGCKCELCGWSEKNKYTNTYPLEIHHIDGNYKNNNEENLQLLCPNCHSLTETAKSHNKNGRKGRKKYDK